MYYNFNFFLFLQISETVNRTIKQSNKVLSATELLKNIIGQFGAIETRAAFESIFGNYILLQLYN